VAGRSISHQTRQLAFQLGWQKYRRFHLYSGTGRASLWRASLAGAVLSLALGGCSMSSQLDSIFASASNSDVTGSITPPPGAKQAETLPPAADLALTKAAVSEVLTRGRKDDSVPWENPATGARGTVTPIASAYSEGGHTCHDFLASYVSGGSESWLQGEACKQTKGAWEVRSMKPWKRS
jgi:17 kDa outer membrane surface antigen